MRVFRIASRKWAPTAMTGIGAAITGGRWNSAGTPVVYTADSLASAMLEALVHMDPLTAPPSMVFIEVTVPDDIVHGQIVTEDLPDGWRDIPPPTELARLGDAWVQGGTSAVLRVPSAVVPGASNYVLNPAHQDAARFETSTPEPLLFDGRLRGE